jgi:hypothetical protein
MILAVAMFCIFANVTASSEIVVANDPEPVPVTSPVRVIVGGAMGSLPFAAWLAACAEGGKLAGTFSSSV